MKFLQILYKSQWIKLWVAIKSFEELDFMVKELKNNTKIFLPMKVFVMNSGTFKSIIKDYPTPLLQNSSKITSLTELFPQESDTLFCEELFTSLQNIYPKTHLQFIDYPKTLLIRVNLRNSIQSQGIKEFVDLKVSFFELLVLQLFQDVDELPSNNILESLSHIDQKIVFGAVKSLLKNKILYTVISL